MPVRRRGWFFGRIRCVGLLPFAHSPGPGAGTGMWREQCTLRTAMCAAPLGGREPNNPIRGGKGVRAAPPNPRSALPALTTPWRIALCVFAAGGAEDPYGALRDVIGEHEKLVMLAVSVARVVCECALDLETEPLENGAAAVLCVQHLDDHL